MHNVFFKVICKLCLTDFPDFCTKLHSQDFRYLVPNLILLSHSYDLLWLEIPLSSVSLKSWSEKARQNYTWMAWRYFSQWQTFSCCQFAANFQALLTLSQNQQTRQNRIKQWIFFFPPFFYPFSPFSNQNNFLTNKAKKL